MTAARALVAALVSALLFAVPVSAGGDLTSSPSSARVAVGAELLPTKTTIRFFGSESGESLVVGHREYISAYATTEDAQGGDHAVTGTLSLWVDGIELADGTLPLPLHASFGLGPGSLSLGTHFVEAFFTGETDFESSSDLLLFEIVAETVEAKDVKLDLTTFYPVSDGYRDVVQAVGNRLEPASVAIVVYDSNGVVRKRLAVGMGSGPYSATWNGRTSSGSIRASGRYRVIQTLTDATGLKRRFTSYVNLSRRKLVFKTTYVTKRATSYSAKDTSGGGNVTTSSAGYLKVTAGSTATGWAGVGWQFRLPSAVYYRRMAFQLEAIAPASTGQNLIGLDDFRSCPLSAAAWSKACFGGWKSISSSSRVWHSASGAAYNRSGRYVRGMLSAHGASLKVYRVRVKVTYGVWAS